MSKRKRKELHARALDQWRKGIVEGYEDQERQREREKKGQEGRIPLFRADEEGMLGSGRPERIARCRARARVLDTSRAVPDQNHLPVEVWSLVLAQALRRDRYGSFDGG